MERDATFQLTAVAFLRSTGGEVRVLLAVDRDGQQLFDGEPALLAAHRAGRDPELLELEGADRIPQAAVDLARTLACRQIAAMVEAAHDEFGQLDGELLLGRHVSVVAPATSFDA